MSELDQKTYAFITHITIYFLCR